jgi:hypothetical protein
MAEYSYTWQPLYATVSNRLTQPTLAMNAGYRGPAGVGVPTGGEAGEYLQKQSGSDYDADWVTLDTEITTATATDLDGLIAGDGSTVYSLPLTTYQPLDSDLTAIAALSTTSFGRALLTLASAAAGRSALELGTAAVLDASNVAKLDAANTFSVGGQVIQVNSSSVTGLTIQRTAGFDGTLFAVRYSDGGSIFSVAGSGSISAEAMSLSGSLSTGAGVSLTGNNWNASLDSPTKFPGSYIFFRNAAAVTTLLASPDAGLTPLGLRNAASQTADTLQLSGISSTSAVRSQAAVNSSWATATDASRQGQVSIGAYGIVGGTDTLQTGLTVTATSGGTAAVTFPGTVALGDVTSAAATVSLWNNASNVGIGSAGLGPGLYLAFNSRLAVARDMLFAWSGVSQDANGAVDTALGRHAAGVVEVNNGTAGTYRDLVARTLIARQVGGTPGTDEVRLYNDANGSWLQDMEGSALHITGGGAVTVGANPAAPFVTGWVFYSGTTVRLNSSISLAWTPASIWDNADTDLSRTAAGQLRLSRLGTNGSSSVLSFAGPSSLGTVRDVAVLTSSYATAADASFQGQLSLGVRGIVGGTDTLQEGMRITATASGTPTVTVVGRPRLNSNVTPILDFYDGDTYKGSVGITVFGNDVILGSPSNSMVFRQAGGGFLFGNSSADEIMRLTNAGNLICVGTIRTNPVTVAALPSAATAGEGARAFVTDADSTTFNAAAVGGGSNKVPVFSNGTAWFVG